MGWTPFGVAAKIGVPAGDNVSIKFGDESDATIVYDGSKLVITGDAAPGGDLQLLSTSNATKGTIFFGTASAYDQVNDRIGIGTTTPSFDLSFGNGASRTIAPESIAATGKSLSIVGGQGTGGVVVGGALNLTGGQGAGGGGAVNIDGGAGTSTGGDVTLDGGTGGLTPGDVFLCATTGNVFLGRTAAGTISIRASCTISDAKNFVLASTTGTKIGTATTQKLAFFNSTPIVQPAATTDLRQALIDLGLYATGGASPLNLNGGALTAASARVQDDGLLIENPANTFLYTIQAAAIAANRILNLPLITGTDTLATLGLAQTFTDTQTFNLAPVPGADNSINLGSDALSWQYGYLQKGLQIAANQYAFQVSDTSGSGMYFDATTPRNVALRVSAVNKHVFYMGAANAEGACLHFPRTSDPSTALPNGTIYILDNGASDFWMKLQSNSIWTEVEQREEIAVTPSATITFVHHAFTNVYAEWTAGQNETVNASGTQIDGQMMTLLIHNDATSARTITFGTGFRASATIVGTVSKAATISFRSNGTSWFEISRALVL